MELFKARARTDRSPRRPDEPSFAFLDRTGSDFFVPVRELLQRWLNALPAEDRPGVAGNLSSGEDDMFDSAFWELYLHRMLTGAGHDVEIHPDVPGISKHPDFLVHGHEPFYVEAVSVGYSPGKRSSERRLHDVEAVLGEARVDGWTLSFNWQRIGSQPLKATRLRAQLLSWLSGLSRDHQLQARQHLNQPGHSPKLPLLVFDEAGWKLDFTALPVSSNRVPLVSISGAGRASSPNNEPGLCRVLSNKSRRYGDGLPYPLVTAVLSNTEFPTRLYEIQPTLYGGHWLGPAQVADFTELSSEGHWRTNRGWRRSHNPYVVVGCGINLYNVANRAPWLWRTLDPAVTSSLDLPWAMPIDVTVPEPQAPLGRPDLAALGITEGWCTGDPDFDER